MLRIAQLGCGQWGRRLLAHWRTRSDVRIVTVIDPRGGPGVKAEETALWRRGDVDAVIVASPPACHAAHARRALERGWHAFVEKPLALRGGDALVGLAASQGRVLMVGHVVLYDEGALQVKRWIREGRLGRLRRITFRRWGRAGARAVDALWSLGPHDVALVDHWLDAAPLRVVASRGWSPAPSGPCDEAWVDLRTGRTDVHLHVGHGRAAAPRGAPRRAAVAGTKATVVLEGPRASLHRGGAAVEVHVRRRDPLEAELDDFVRCVRTGRRPRADAASGARVVRVLADAVATRRRQTARRVAR